MTAIKLTRKTVRLRCASCGSLRIAGNKRLRCVECGTYIEMEGQL